MRPDEMLDFLKDHQPLPDHPPTRIMDRFKEILCFFYENPDEACIPLLLQAFSEWDDLTLYESVQSVIRKFPKGAVLPHLKAALMSPHYSVRLWCADTASHFPDRTLVPFLAKALEERSAEMRMASAVALEKIGDPSAAKAAAKALAGESDKEVREVLSAIIDSQGEIDQG